jgi:NAD(P)-dependent dehydrogenase (short-subunit alcohol dehydrogenase family)
MSRAQDQASRSILITGCSSGIGRHAALGLKARGWRVFAGVRKKEDMEALAKEGVEPIHLDYDSPANISVAFHRVLDLSGGRLDALFNNGAYSQLGAVEDLDTDLLRAQFETNFFGWHELIRRVVPVMRRQGSGRIVNCSSILGFVSPRFRAAYASSKFALEAMSDSLRLELSGSGIYVVLIEPGPIYSRLAEAAVARFRETIAVDKSPHRETYEATLRYFERGPSSSYFKLGPEAVLRKLIHALESRSPRPRYRVTIPTHAAALMKRLLSTRTLDRILRRQR